MNKKQKETETSQIIIEIDPVEGTITRDDAISKIEPLIFNLLIYLRQNNGVIVSRQQLMEEVWHSPYTSDTAINRGISALRKALGGNRDDFIKTLPKKGYSFNLPSNVKLIDVENESSPQMPAQSEVKITNKQPSKISENLQSRDASEPKAPQTKLPYFSKVSMGLKRALLVGTIGLVCSAGFYHFEPIKAPSDVSSGSEIITAKTHTPLYIESIAVNRQDARIGVMATTLQNQIINKIYSIKEIKPIIALDDESSGDKKNRETGIKFQSKLMSNDDQVSLQLKLFDYKKKELIYSTVLTAPTHGSAPLELFFANEVIAVIKLFVFYQRFAYDYLKSLELMTYQDIELMASVRSYSVQGVGTGLRYSLRTLEQLETKYPNNAEILGLKSLVWSQRVKFDDSEFAKHIRQQVEFGEQALAIDPENYDAIASLFYLTNSSSHSREQSRLYMNRLMRYHSNRMSTWRAQLYAMTRDAKPCSEIKTFVNRIPDGLFNPYRLKVIHQILDSCVKQTGLEDLIAQISNLPNSRKDRTIHKNIFLFKRKHSKVLDSVDYHLNINQSMSISNDAVLLYSMFDDAVTVNSLLSKLNGVSDGFWYAQAQLIDYVYRGSSEFDQQVLDLMDYEFLNRRTEMLLVSYMAQLLTDGKTDTRYLEKYIEDHQEFSISIATRRESVALMNAYYAIGEVEQSQAIAHRLYETLERYRKEDIASFRFWYLGSLHLAARLYCGELCQTDDSVEGYLADTFGPNHPWWGDHLGFMTQTLKPWQDDELVKAYLSKVRASIAEVQSQR